MPNGLLSRLELKPYMGFGVRFRPATRAELRNKATPRGPDNGPELGQFPYWFGAQAYINREAIVKAQAEHFVEEQRREMDAMIMKANNAALLPSTDTAEDATAAIRIEQVKKFVPVALAVGLGLLLMGTGRRF